MNNTNKSTQIGIEEEIDLSKIWKIISRNKSLISLTSFVFLLLAIIYSSFQKKVWLGKFSIVLEQSENPAQNFVRNNSLIFETLNIKQSSSLDTEVGILESPSVLMPIYDFVMNEKRKSNPQYEIPFEAWKKGFLNIKLKFKTSILDISYKDSKKEIIIPVLEKISKAYQKYSKEKDKSSNILAIKYLEEQIKIYKEKSVNSIKNAQEYALDKDLSILEIGQSPKRNLMYNANITTQEILKGITPSLDDYTLSSNLRIEESRVTAANKIRKIDKQIEKINSLNDVADEIEYISYITPTLNKEGLPELLTQLELRIINGQSKYKPNSIYLKKLYEEREILKKTIKEKAISHLKAQRILAESQKEAAERPKEVILKYKELMREANRNEDTLIQLENNVKSIKIKESLKSEPWQLILEPTMLKKPVSNGLGYFAVLGITLGSLFGFILSLLFEKKSGKVYDKDFLENIFETSIIADINNKNADLNNGNIYIKAFFKKEKNNINLIKLGINEDISNETILNSIIEKTNGKNLFNGNEIIFIKNNLEDLDNSKTNIIISNLDELSKKEVLELKRYISLNQIIIKGILLIS